MLDYDATYLGAVITYRASYMVLDGHIDTSYLYESGSRSRSGGHVLMTDELETHPNNGAIMTMSQIIKAFISLSTEAVPAQIVPEEMGHRQTPMPIQTDNTNAIVVVNDNIVSKHLKSMDMGINLLRYIISQEQFHHYSKPGPTNSGEYSTKPHVEINHHMMRPKYLTPKKYLDLLRKRNRDFGAVAAYKSNSHPHRLQIGTHQECAIIVFVTTSL